MNEAYLPAARSVPEQEPHLASTLVVGILDDLDDAMKRLDIGTLGAARGALEHAVDHPAGRLQVPIQRLNECRCEERVEGGQRSA